MRRPKYALDPEQCTERDASVRRQLAKQGAEDRYQRGGENLRRLGAIEAEMRAAVRCGVSTVALAAICGRNGHPRWFHAALEQVCA